MNSMINNENSENNNNNNSISSLDVSLNNCLDNDPTTTMNSTISKFGQDLKQFFFKSVDRGEKDMFIPSLNTFLKKQYPTYTHSTILNFLIANQDHDVIFQIILGCFYERGIGTAVDEIAAYNLYKGCSETHQDPTAQALLALCYLDGIGTEKSSELGFEWSQRSADAGSAAGQNNLAYCYATGTGTQKCYRSAWYWALRSAGGGSAVGQLALGFFHEDERQMDTAREWYLKSAENGNTNAQVRLAKTFSDGGVDGKMDKKRAFHWFRISAVSGNSEGQQGYATCFEQGIGVQRNLHEALLWYHRALKNKRLQAKTSLAELLGALS
ncbi:hypothetical protein G9A89_023447 [Geosiphon pyriformis]|nr:hypothetical protein G9A89_023447 [Geosiphon pyriformis]